jgi:phospholipid/cholesterol/gamma-HCH transport system substrate-binding protein
VNPRTRAAAAALAGLTLAAALSGCGTGGLGGIQNLPLPGGADLGGHPYTVKARFADVLDLVPQASVRVNDVAVGRVSDIALAADGWSATVTMKVNGAVRLPANAYAELEQSSLLGEKYVQLSAPPAGQRATGRLSGGAVIPISRTNRDPQVEEVLGALSLLLNGGGLQQLHTISAELDKALTGNEPQVRDMLTQVDTLVSDLDTHKKDITDALDGVDQLSATLAARDRQIGTVLTGLSPGLKTLEQQRGSLVTMLRSLDTLSGVAVDTVNRGKADMVADLRALAPTLRRLADSGQDLPDSLQVLLTYPFTDQVLSGVKGDYLNVYLDLTAAPGTQLIPEMPADQNVYPPPTMDPGAAPAGRRPAAAGAPGASPGARTAGTPGASPAAGGIPLPLPTATTVRSR